MHIREETEIKTKLHEKLLQAIKENDKNKFDAILRKNETNGGSIKARDLLRALEIAIEKFPIKIHFTLRLLQKYPEMVACLSNYACQKISHCAIIPQFTPELVELLIKHNKLMFFDCELFYKLMAYIGTFKHEKFKKEIPEQPDKVWLKKASNFVERVLSCGKIGSRAKKKIYEIKLIIDEKKKTTSEVDNINIPSQKIIQQHFIFRTANLFINDKAKFFLLKDKPSYESIRCNEAIVQAGKDGDFHRVIENFKNAKQNGFLDDYIKRSTNVALNKGIKIKGKSDIKEAISLYVFAKEHNLDNEIIKTTMYFGFLNNMKLAKYQHDFKKAIEVFEIANKLGFEDTKFNQMLDEIFVNIKNNIDLNKNEKDIVWLFEKAHEYGYSDRSLCNSTCNLLSSKSDSRKIFNLFFLKDKKSKLLLPSPIKNSDGVCTYDLHGLDIRTTYHFLEYLNYTKRIKGEVWFNVGVGKHSKNFDFMGKHPVRQGFSKYVMDNVYKCVQLDSSETYLLKLKFISNLQKRKIGQNSFFPMSKKRKIGTAETVKCKSLD